MVRKNTVTPTKQIPQILAANGHEISDGNGHRNSCSFFILHPVPNKYRTCEKMKKSLHATNLGVRDRTKRGLKIRKVNFIWVWIILQYTLKPVHKLPCTISDIIKTFIRNRRRHDQRAQSRMAWLSMTLQHQWIATTQPFRAIYDHSFCKKFQNKWVTLQICLKDLDSVLQNMRTTSSKLSLRLRESTNWLSV